MLCRGCRIGDWSADSAAMVVVKAENNAGRLTWIIVASGESRDLIVSPDKSVNRPFPSPDGHLLAFRISDSSGDAIMVAPLTTEQPVSRQDWIQIAPPETDARPGGWAPDQRLTREEALHAMTRGAAFAAHAERDLGSIEPGKLADFVVLSRDIMQVEPHDVLSTAIVRTVVGGRTVYER